MKKSMAWDVASVRPKARRIAEEAAHRAGVSLEEWLDEAILRKVASAISEEGDDEFRRYAVERGGHAWLDANAMSRLRRMLQREEARDREAKSFFESAIARIERQMSRGEDHMARAFKTMEDILERTGAGDRATPPRAPPQADVRDDHATRAQSQTFDLRGDDTASWSASNSFKRAARRHQTEGIEVRQPRVEATRHMTDEPKASRGPLPERRRPDLESTVSQIALRRQTLDTREAREAREGSGARKFSPTPNRAAPSGQISNPLAASEPSDRRQTRFADVAGARSRSNSPDDARVELGASQSSPVAAPPEDIRALAAKLERLLLERADQSRCAIDLTSMREEIAAMTRSLAEIAPRNAVVALEGAVRDLIERVALLRQNTDRESLLAPLAAMATELRATLKAHNPQAAVAGLERELTALSGKIDTLAKATINPEGFERIQRQTEEVRDLLAAAAMRAAPAERLERRISELADRIERLGASPAPQVESARMAASLADVRREIERSAPLSSLVAIERRLEQIAARLDLDITQPNQAHLKQQAFEDLARRIDGVRQSMEARSPPKIDTSGLESSLQELNTKLESLSAEALKTLMHDINDKLDAAAHREPESDSIEVMLAEIINKLDQILRTGASAPISESGAIERALQSLDPRQDFGLALASETASRIAEGVTRRLEEAVTPHMQAQGLAEQITRIHDRLEMFSGLDGMQEILRKLATQLAGEREFSNDDDEPQSLTGRNFPGKSAPSVARVVDALDTTDMSGAGALRMAFKPVTPDSKPASPCNTDEDILLEPGAERPPPERETAQEPGSRTNPSISAHIAAARRAALSAVSEGGVGSGSTGAPPTARGIDRAKSIYANHKRSVLLAIVFAMIATAAARLIGSHSPYAQKSELNGQPMKSAAIGGSSSKETEPSKGLVPDMRPVDTTPTASIAPAPEAVKSDPSIQSPRPELTPTIAAALSTPLRNAVMAGSPAAEYELAQRLFEGRGMPQDKQAAASWLEHAASLGLAPAQFRLGTLYQEGIGVPRDLSAAKRWYANAAEAGNVRAAHNLALMHAQPAGEKPDYVEAAKWFRRAAELGLRDSQFNLAVLYARGLGIDQDLRQSWLWFSLAAAQGDADAAKKRDEVAAKMDPSALAAAAGELARFKAAKADPLANEVVSPSGGWDSFPGASPLSHQLTAPPPAGVLWAL